MKYLKKFNERKVYKDLTVEEVKNMLVELLDVGFDIKITSTNGLCKTNGNLWKNIDMVDFLDNLLSFIAKMENIGGYERIKSQVYVKESNMDNDEQYNSFSIDFKLKDFIRNPNDVTDSDSFEGYITNIGFKYIDNQAEIDLYGFKNIEVVFEEEGFLISIQDIYDEENLDKFIKNYTDEEKDFITKNISFGYTNEHPYNKESIDILEKMIKIVK